MYKEKIVNVLTGQETWRDYTDTEIAEAAAAQAEAEAEAQAKAAAQAERSVALAKLEALGLTVSDLEALGL